MARPLYNDTVFSARPSLGYGTLIQCSAVQLSLRCKPNLSCLANIFSLWNFGEGPKVEYMQFSFNIYCFSETPVTQKCVMKCSKLMYFQIQCTLLHHHYNYQTWAKPGAALQTALWLIHELIKWVSLFLPQLYGAATRKWFQIAFPVIK